MTIKYRAAIESIENWQILTDSAIALRLTEKTHLWQDPEWWSAWGVATVIGARNVKPFLDRLRQSDFDWVADALVGHKAPFGNVDVNNMMLASGDPDMIKIAQATVRFISICERFGLPDDQQAIIADVKEMRLEILRKALIAVGAERWNIFHRAVLAWDGDPNTEPQL